MQGHTEKVFQLQFDEFQIVSSSNDDTIMIWEFLKYTPPERVIADFLRMPISNEFIANFKFLWKFRFILDPLLKQVPKNDDTIPIAKQFVNLKI